MRDDGIASGRLGRFEWYVSDFPPRLWVTFIWHSRPPHPWAQPRGEVPDVPSGQIRFRRSKLGPVRFCLATGSGTILDAWVR